jgi:hypothetical protein
MARFASGSGQAGSGVGADFAGSQLLQAKAGPEAINTGDLVALAGMPKQLWPVESADHAAVAGAGQAVFPATLVNPYPGDNYQRRKVAVDPTDKSIFYAEGHVTGSCGCKVWRFSATGQLIGSVVLDATAGASTRVMISRLSDGNYVVVWYNVPSPYKLFFAILSPLLHTLVPKTEIATAGTNPSLNADMVPLSGGGFAVAWAHSNVGNYVAIYGNDGTEISAPALVAGAPINNSGNVNGPHFKLAQLSNGNIFVGWADVSQANKLALAIYDTAGASVVGYTTIAGSKSASNGGGRGFPEISVMGDHLCFVGEAGTAHILDNNGVQQGASIPLEQWGARVVNDGTSFLLLSEQTFGSNIELRRIATDGSIQRLDVLEGSFTVAGDLILERGRLLLSAKYLISFGEGDVPYLENTLADPTTTISQTVAGLGDFSFLMAKTNGEIEVIKYDDTSILGVSRTQVAANSDGTLVEVLAGPGGVKTNEFTGTIGKSFDHTGATPSGNKGILYGNSVKLEGV